MPGLDVYLNRKSAFLFLAYMPLGNAPRPLLHPIRIKSDLFILV